MHYLQSETEFMKIFLIVILSWVMCSCSASLDAGAIYQTTFDFSKVERYGLYDRNAAFNDSNNVSDTLRNTIELAIERSADKKGFIYSDIAQADLVITYYIIDSNKASLSAYNQQVLYCDYCLRANNWHSDNKNWELKPGHIIIDLIDPKSKRSVWRSAHPLKLKVKESSRIAREKIQEIITAMLEEYPAEI